MQVSTRRTIPLATALILAASARPGAQTVEPDGAALVLARVGTFPIKARQGELLYDVDRDRYVLAVEKDDGGVRTVFLREIPIAGTSFPAMQLIGPGAAPALGLDRTAQRLVLAFGAGSQSSGRTLDLDFATLSSYTLTTGGQNPDLLYDPGGGEFLFLSGSGVPATLLGRRLSASTGPVGSQLTITTGFNLPLDSTFDASAGVHLIGHAGSVPKSYEVLRVDRAGQLLAPPVTLGPWASSALDMDLVHDPRRSRNLAVYLKASRMIVGQFFSGDGTLIGAPFDLFETVGDSPNVAAAYSPLSDAFAVVELSTGVAANQFLRSALVQPDGSVGPIRVHGRVPAGTTDLRIALRPADDTLLVSWPHNGELYGQRYRITGPRPTLTLTGCGGAAAQLQLSGATPSGMVALTWSSALGTFVVPGSVCGGLILQLDRPQVAAVLPASSAGTLTLALPPIVCAIHIQALDVSACRASNVVP